MTVTRENILSSQTARDNFLNAVVELDRPNSGVTAQMLLDFVNANGLPLTIQGVNQELSIYDLFVFWHVLAMRLPLPPGNAAHSGPIFLPWHRLYMIRLEEQMQQALGDTDVALPYWDWAADGELPATAQHQTLLWDDNALGTARGAVTTGPLSDVRVRLWQDPQTGILWSINPRPIMREAGLDRMARTLPRQNRVTQALNESDYDASPWDWEAVSHRNRLEGWLGGPRLHNRVHVWVGGDMGPGSSPNDPVFFLNHCNVDRIWEAWMVPNNRAYQPQAGAGPDGHRVDSTMVAIFGDALRPQDVLNPAQWYQFDSLQVD